MSGAVAPCGCPLTALASCAVCDLEDVPACDHAAEPVCATCRAAGLEPLTNLGMEDSHR
jgi:hypothetical protein